MCPNPNPGPAGSPLNRRNWLCFKPALTIEVYFSIVQRKVLTPNDFESLAEVEDRLLGFQERYEQAAKPFQWKFTRRDLDRLLARIEAADCRGKAA